VANLAPLLPKVSKELVKATVADVIVQNDGSFFVRFAKTYFGTYMGEMSVSVNTKGEQKWLHR
jgi:hypothetical protein